MTMETNLLWMAGGLVIGVILGIVLHRLFHSESAKNRRLEQQIDQLQRQNVRYQAQVSEHFSKTGDLLSRLNSSYRDIFAHLVHGAERLGNDEEFRNRLPFGPVSGMKSNDKPAEEPATSSMAAPLDYAPSAAGTLSESYGFPMPPKDLEVEVVESAEDKGKPPAEKAGN